MSQEAFGDISSRTYISALERGLKNPTLGKIDELADVLQVHPLTLVAQCYLQQATVGEVDALLSTVRAQLLELNNV